MSIYKKEVLTGFKNLHRAVRCIFRDDDFALNAAKIRISSEYKKNKHLDNETSIKEMLKFATEVEAELKGNVIQAKEKEPGVYELQINENTTKLENVMFKPDAVIERPTRSGNRKCK